MAEAETRAQLQRFQGGLDKLEALIRSQSSRKTADPGANEQTTPVQEAHRHLAAAQSLHHAFLMYLRTQGRATKDHPIHKETERLKFYAKKVRKLESADYLSTHKPSMEVNVAAANRFISHAIPELSQQQRAALKKGGDKQVTGGKKRRTEHQSEGADAARLARKFLKTLESPQSNK